MFSREVVQKDFLHPNLALRSDKQHSAQGSVFYVKNENEDNQEFVLKIVNSVELTQ